MTAVAPKLNEASPPQGAEANSAAALQRLQDDMELISYVASHDLMAPLRMMLVASETLKEKLDFSHNPEAQEALQAMDEYIKHLRALLQGLQEYVRLETFTFRNVPLESSELVTTATETLAEEIKASGAVVTWDQLPRVTGHRGRLNRLFIYLLENAIRYRSAEPPRVHISAREAGGMWEFTVEDNGIGIDEEFHEIIFRLFQRLHSIEAYPGYGIGLALSQKIVASHGGRIEVESSPGKGSRFHFTLPAANE